MAINLQPTEEMAAEARRGLEWRREFNRGGTEVGVARARDISNRVNLSPDTIGRMVSYFARHEVDKQAEGFRQGEQGYPSAGRIAWALWGGDAGKAWANKKSEQLKTENFMIEIENKSAKVKLNDTVHKFSVDQIIEEIEKVYGAKAVENSYAFGEVTACIENAVDTLEIEIHSPGGSVFEGYRIYNAMKELRERGVYVTAKINTLAASMGSVIAMAADKITIASNGRMMIHDASSGVHGNADAMRKTADMLEEISDEIAGVYAEKTGKDKDDIRKMMKSETWISAKKAVEMGFADEIFDTKSKVMSILSKFMPDAQLVEKVSGLEASLADAENQITDISAQLAEAQNDLATAVSELSELKASAEKLAEEKAQIEASFNEAETAIANLTTERDQIANELKEQAENHQKEIEAAKASAETRAAEILAQAGVPPVADANDKISMNVKTLTEFNALTPAGRMSFLKKGGKISN